MKSLIREVCTRSINKTKFLKRYFISAIQGAIQSKKFKDVKNLCLFVGYGRSGHTLVASFLDAHPNIIIGIEWDLLSYLRLGFKRNQVIYSLVKRSQDFSKNLKNVWTGYSYQVKDSWQGEYQKLKVIGDKLGEGNSKKLFVDQDILRFAEKKIRLKPKIIHVVRNPFDMITTKTIRSFEMNKIKENPNTIDMLPNLRKIFANADVIMRLKKENEYPLIDVYHEELIKNPKPILIKLLDFLEVEPIESYIENCISIMYEQPHKSRYSIPWPDELIEYVENEMKKYPFFHHYRYND